MSLQSTEFSQRGRTRREKKIILQYQGMQEDGTRTCSLPRGTLTFYLIGF